MISKKYIKGLGFNDINEFYNYIIESKINGNYTQTKNFIKRLSSDQFLNFIDFLRFSGYGDCLSDQDKHTLIKMREE